MRDHFLAQIDRRLKEQGISERALCVAAKVDVDTIRNVRRAQSALPKYETLVKLANVLGCSLAELTGEEALGGPMVNGVRLKGFEDIEATPFQPRAAQQSEPELAIQALYPGRPNTHLWEIKSSALNMAGFMPGDVLIVDLSRTAKAGDLVCAQVTFPEGVRTVFRFYEPPYLVARSTEQQYNRPELVDNDRAIIMGVVAASFRLQRD
jgi:transcriptional regulator with XRE-family HTH domain